MNTETWFAVPGSVNTPALRKLERISQYPKGWAHGTGAAFSHDIIEKARRALTVAASLGLQRTDVFPRRDGGLVVSVYFDNETHDFTVHANGDIEWLHEVGNEEIECRLIKLTQLDAKLIELARQQQWNSCGYWSQTILIQTVDASRVLPSRHQALTERFPASTPPVPLELLAATAHT